jgi:hypothetical protein
MMRRLSLLVTVALVMAAMMVAMAAPAIAQGQGALPPGGPCGVISGFGVGEARPTDVEPAENPPGIFFDCVPTGRPS